MKRRTLLKGSLAAGAALALPAAGIRLARAADPVTIYGLKSLSGAYASFGKFANMGSKLAVDDYGKVLGGDVAYEVINTESSASTAVRKVQEAVQQHNAELFVGGHGIFHGARRRQASQPSRRRIHVLGGRR